MPLPVTSALLTAALLTVGRVTAAAPQTPAPPASAAPAPQTPAPPASPPQTPPAQTFTVDVVATAPLPGVELAADKIAAPVQTATQEDILRSGALNVADFFNRRLSGVHVNEVQSNPFQPDVNYRGYTASPLLGTPQGLSVYMDGVRLNQPFGDVVSWDLIPRMAIASTTLMPGSNPVFGLNTLGGALSLQTKDGLSAKGTTVQALYGSGVRRAIEFEHGGSRRGGLNWYVAGTVFGEDGWREESPSDVRQIFGKIGWQAAARSVAVTGAYANNVLNGNGLQEIGFLARDSASVYTKPDITDNRAGFLNLTLRQAIGPAWLLTGNAYYRDIRTATFNGDINEDALDQSIYQPNAEERAALANAGYTGVPASGATAANTPFPSWRCLGNVLLRDEPGEQCNGLLNRGHDAQKNGGVAGQLTRVDQDATRANQLTIGGAFDRSTVSFSQSTELGYLNPDRSITGTGAFADGVSGGTVDGEPFDARVDLRGLVRTWGLYATDTLSLQGRWHVTLSARYNETRVRNADRLHPGGGEGSLDGEHVFRRLNPAAGVTFTPAPRINAYVSYSEGSRAATSIELGCADPDQPCKLPNAMAGDPPVDQVVTRTVEGGLRGRLRALSWSAGVFRANNDHDILFVTSDQTGFGYFRNFGQTRREGVELDARTRTGRVTFGAGYTYLNATYQSDEVVNGQGNSTNDAAAGGAPGFEGRIAIAPGDRIPLIPAHVFKSYADIALTRALSVDVDLIATSRIFARGNENNAHEPDGVYYLGAGTAPGYAVVNLSAAWQVRPWMQVIGQVNNVFDRAYYTAAQLGPLGFADDGSFIARPLPAIDGEYPVRSSTFLAPGAPVRASAGLRFTF